VRLPTGDCHALCSKVGIWKGVVCCMFMSIGEDRSCAHGIIKLDPNS
jgi:hypothetical protein